LPNAFVQTNMKAKTKVPKLMFCSSIIQFRKQPALHGSNR
jgi:hypothetical protein